jgi:hypothetical protein
VMLLSTGDGGFRLAVTLDVVLPSVSDPAAAIELVRAGHRVCPYSNATRGNIDVALTANGQTVDLRELGRAPIPIGEPTSEPAQGMATDSRGWTCGLPV